MTVIYLDIETDNSLGYNGLDVFGGRIVTVQMLLPDGKIIILKDPTQADMDKVKPILEKNLIVGHGLKFDCKFLKQKFGINLYHVYDTFIAEIALSGGMYANYNYCRINKIGLGLKDLVFRYFGTHLDKGEQTGFMYEVPLTPEQIKYAANDLKYLPEIHKQQMAKAKVMKIEKTIDIEMKVLPAVVWMELSGFYMDLTKVAIVERKLRLILDATTSYLIPIFQPYYKGKVNLNSSKPLGNALRSMGYDLPRKEGKKPGEFTYSTDEDSLAVYKNDKLIRMLLKYKYATKFMSTSISPIKDKIIGGRVIKSCINANGRTYTNFKQYGTETGRFSCSQNDIRKLPIQCINFQTQPKRLNWRSVFVSESGHKLIVSDYSQIEPRIMAQVSGDPKMIDAYKTGKDLYKLTAEAIFGIPYDKVDKNGRERAIAKQITLGLCYGLGTPGLIKKLQTESNITLTQSEAKYYISKFKQNYPVVTRFLDQIGYNAVKTCMARNVCGRVRKFTPVKSDKDMWIIKNAAKNAVIQSLSADITKIAMANLFLILEPMGVKLCNTIHDELVFEAPNEIAQKVAKIVEDEMIKAAKIFLTNVPCIADTSEPINYWKK